MIGIYKITNPKGKIYIGQSVNINKRWNRYRNLIQSDCIGQPLLYRSFIKYGIDNHCFEIIELCNIEKLNEFESKYITLYNSFNTKHGLNLTSGGTNYIFSDISRKKMSIAQKNKKPISEETRNRMSIASRSRDMAYNKGKIQSEETKSKRSLSLIGIKKVKFICPHCKLEGGGGAMKQWHFDKCKYK